MSCPLRFPALRIELPAWIEAWLPDSDHVFESVEERMRLAVDLARLNVKHRTGGPFGAAVFDCETHRLLAPGVNLVVSSKWSGGHGEMIALAIAQQITSTHDLGGPGMPPYELVTSVEPCAMCFGATPWSGVRRLVCGARDRDARDIGFDEGPKLEHWVEALRSRGIDVTRDVLRYEARDVLVEYASQGGKIYNGRTEA